MTGRPYLNVSESFTRWVIGYSAPESQRLLTLLFDAINAGAYGYILKQIGSDDLINALDATGSGRSIRCDARRDRSSDGFGESSPGRILSVLIGIVESLPRLEPLS